MRVVVSGGAGFLGSALCRALLARGDEVVCVDNLVTGKEDNVAELMVDRRFTFIHHDVSNPLIVPGAVDAVMHLASPASPRDFTEIPIKILKVGSLGTHNLLGLAHARGARFFLASTSEVYGDPLVHPQVETYWGNVNPIGPRSVYDEAKRFAEAMTMAYHRQHGLDVRIVRIFNSILADEQILYDDGVELRRERAEDLARRLHGQIDLAGFSVPAFDGAGTVSAAAASAFIGHPTASTCYRVTTRYGRTIKVTGDHSLFVADAHGRPVARAVTDLAVGDKVAIAGRVVVPERDRTVVDMTAAWRAGGHDDWDLLVCHPGAARRREVVGLVGPVGDHHRARQIDVDADRSELPLGAVAALGLDLPDDAVVRCRGGGGRLPAWVEVTDDFLWLLGLYAANGGRFSGHPGGVRISGDTDVLERAAKVLEQVLGVHCQAHPTIVVHSRLLLVLLDHLGFPAGEERIPGWVLGLPLSRLKWFVEGYRAGAQATSEFSAVSERLKDDLVVAFARFGLVASVGRRRSTSWCLTLSRVDPWSPLDWDRGVRQTLDAGRYGDLIWAPIESISEVPATGVVYDFSVPGLENFWAGGGIMAHNTYGPYMRPEDGRVVSNFVMQALRNESITIYGDGSQTRSFTYVDDEIAGFLRLLDSDYVGPVNIGNPDEFTVAELAQLVIELTASTSDIIHRPLPEDDPTQRRPDITLARSVLGWEPTIPLPEGLVRTIDWFRTKL